MKIRDGRLSSTKPDKIKHKHKDEEVDQEDGWKLGESNMLAVVLKNKTKFNTDVQTQTQI